MEGGGIFQVKIEGARGVLAGSARSVGRGREPEEAPVYTAL